MPQGGNVGHGVFNAARGGGVGVGQPAGLPSGMPGIGELMEGAMQQAPQFGRQSTVSRSIIGEAPFSPISAGRPRPAGDRAPDSSTLGVRQLSEGVPWNGVTAKLAASSSTRQTMRAIGNFLWFILGGVVMGLAWWLVGLVALLTIVGIPWAKASFVIGQQVERLAADTVSCLPSRVLEDDAQVNLRFDGGAVGRLWTSSIAIGRPQRWARKFSNRAKRPRGASGAVRPVASYLPVSKPKPKGE